MRRFEDRRVRRNRMFSRIRRRRRLLRSSGNQLLRLTSRMSRWTTCVSFSCSSVSIVELTFSSDRLLFHRSSVFASTSTTSASSSLARSPTRKTGRSLRRRLCPGLLILATSSFVFPPLSSSNHAYLLLVLRPRPSLARRPSLLPAPLSPPQPTPSPPSLPSLVSNLNPRKPSTSPPYRAGRASLGSSSTSARPLSRRRNPQRRNRSTMDQRSRLPCWSRRGICWQRISRR